jgi:hypothetical protein
MCIYIIVINVPKILALFPIELDFRFLHLYLCHEININLKNIFI